MTSTLDHIAKEIADEAHCIGLSQISWERSEDSRKDAWRMLASAAISAMRDEVGVSVVDRILAPQDQR